MDERLQRIAAMEALLDRVLAARDRETVREALRILEEYYDSPLWRADYEADEAGLLPQDLKRGILSQDTLYAILTDDTI